MIAVIFLCKRKIVSSKVSSSFSLNRCISGPNVFISSSCVMPHKALYALSMLISFSWFKSLNTLTCANLVTPVRKTNEDNGQRSSRHRRTLSIFPILIQQVLIQDRLKQWLVILINQHNNLLSCLHACPALSRSKTLFRITVFLLLTIEQLPFSRYWLSIAVRSAAVSYFRAFKSRCRTGYCSHFVSNYSMAKPETSLCVLESKLESGNEQTLAKPTGTA